MLNNDWLIRSRGKALIRITLTLIHSLHVKVNTDTNAEDARRRQASRPKLQRIRRSPQSQCTKANTLRPNLRVNR